MQISEYAKVTILGELRDKEQLEKALVLALRHICKVDEADITRAVRRRSTMHMDYIGAPDDVIRALCLAPDGWGTALQGAAKELGIWKEA